ncbi:MAG: hypothetical protein DRJ49_01590 [Thermoprotei archaeon]|nr:MAG: hypothetical protein DRJ49_01590 [Thermoprotei archaeon]
MMEYIRGLGFRSHMNRLRLHYLLRQNGFYSRIHAYEYLLGFKGSIIGIMVVDPTTNIATLYTHVKLESQVVNRLRECIRAVGGRDLMLKSVGVYFSEPKRDTKDLDTTE